MCCASLNDFSQCLNAECVPQSFKLDQVDGESLLELLLLIQGDAINLSLKLVSDVPSISQAPDRGIYLSIG
jgi:hypothetical protein